MTSIITTTRWLRYHRVPIHPERIIAINPPQTIQQALHHATQRLADAGIDTPRLDAEVLLRLVLDVDRTRLFLLYPDHIADDVAASFDGLIQQRIDGEPVAYLTGRREFMALPFRTTPDVLIPRPDTEPLVEWALTWLDDRPNARVVDVGTGSGAIAISLAAHLPDTFAGEIIAIDVSADALDVTKKNADTLLSPERRSRFTVMEGSLAEPIDRPVNLVLANLPYLTPDQIAENPALDAEPRLALDGGPDGLDLVRILIDDLPRILTPGGAAGFELDPSQMSSAERLLLRTFPGARTEVIQDLSGRQRHVVMERAGV
jgi:release factor glutamine methyltransferase